MDEILTKKGLNRWNILIVVSALGMIGSSIYLLAHYFQTFFPEGLGGNLCNITGFFSCDAVAYSPISTIFSVPISIFGLLGGVFLIIGAIFPSRSLEGTHRFLVKMNAVGCLLLFVYSILFLGHLCPVCTLYYIFSWIALMAFLKGKAITKICPRTFVAYTVVVFITVVSFSYIMKGKKDDQARVASVYAKQFLNYPDLGKPEIDSDYRNISSTTKFDDAPIRITVFSDFQCPACGALAIALKRLEGRYEGKINIQFFFYPLDSACNESVQRGMHPLSCKASYLSACLPKEFSKIHDLIFKNGRNLSDEWLHDLAKKYGVVDCMKSEKIKKKVMDMIGQSYVFNIRATPTMLINGVKIEGVLPLVQLYAILDQLVAK